VDENSRLLIVYHNTGRDFEALFGTKKSPLKQIEQAKVYSSRLC